MRREVRAGFEAGATNLSFGLVYLPGTHADTDELVAVAEVAAEFGAPIVPHIRNEGDGLLEAIDEMLEVSRRSGASLHLSHLKSFADEALIEPLLEKVESAGVTFDQYPYGAGCTLLASLLPAWAQEGGAAATLARMRDPDAVARIGHDVEHGLPGWENLLATSGPERIVVEGVSIADRGGDPVETVAALLLESELGAQMIMHYASEEAVRKIAVHPRMLLGSDGIFGEHPHPAGRRQRGALPRALRAPREAAAAGGGDRAADRTRGRPLRARRPRPDRGRQARRPRPARSRGLRRHRDLRGAAACSRTASRGVWVAGERAWADGAPTGARAGGVVGMRR